MSTPNLNQVPSPSGTPPVSAPPVQPQPIAETQPAPSAETITETLDERLAHAGSWAEHLAAVEPEGPPPGADILVPTVIPDAQAKPIVPIAPIQPQPAPAEAPIIPPQPTEPLQLTPEQKAQAVENSKLEIINRMMQTQQQQANAQAQQIQTQQAQIQQQAQPDPEQEILSKFAVNIPANFVQQLRSEDPAVMAGTLEALFQANAANVYKTAIQDTRTLMKDFIPAYVQDVIGQESRSKAMADDFYNTHPDLNNPGLNTMVAQVAGQLLPQNGGQWSPAVRDAIANTVRASIAQVQQSQQPIAEPNPAPAPQRQQPFWSGGSPVRDPMPPAIDMNSGQAIDAVLGAQWDQ